MRFILIAIVSAFLASLSWADEPVIGEGVGLRGGDAMFQLVLQKIEADADKTVVHILHTSNEGVMTLRLHDPANNTYLVDNEGNVYAYKKAEHIRLEGRKREELTRFHPDIGKKYILTFAPISKDAQTVHLVIMYAGGTPRGCCSAQYEGLLKDIPLEKSE